MFAPVAIALLVLVVYFAFKAKRLAIALEKSQNSKPSIDPNDTIRALFETSNDAIAIIDRNFTIVAANRKTQQEFESVFGQKYDIGANVLELLVEQPQQQVQARKLWSRALGGESFTVTEVFEDGSGERRYYEMSFSPIAGEDSTIERALVLTREISDRVRAEQALQQCNERLESRVRQQTTQLTETNELLQQEIRDRASTQSQLVQQEQLFNAFFQGASVGLVILDPQLRYLQINTALAEIDGVPLEEYQGKTIEDILPDLASTLIPLYRQVLETKEPISKTSLSGETPKQPGVVRYWEASYFPLFGEDENDQPLGVGGVVVEMSDRVRAEEALRENEEKFRQLVESIREVFFIYSADYQKLIYLSPAYEEIWGRSCQDLYDNPTRWLETVYPEDREIVRDELVKQFQGQLFHREFRILKPDDSIVWILGRTFWSRDETGRIGRIVGIAEDISDRKQLEMSLQRSLRRIENLHQLDRAVLEAQDPATLADAAIYNLQQLIPCDRATIATFDFEAQTATILMTRGGGEQSAGVGFQLPLPVFQPLIEQFQQGASYAIADLSLFRGSGEMEALQAERLNEFVSFPLQTEQGLLGILKLWLEEPKTLDREQISIATEVSAQIAIALQQARLFQEVRRYTAELEDRVRERTAQLQDINQELESFTYSVSHDLRAPLRALQGFATALLEDYGDTFDDLGRDYARRLVVAAEQMEQLIQDLLTYSRLSRAELRLNEINLSATIAEAIAQLETPIQQAQAQILVEEPIVSMYGNRAILLQVIANLLSNAIKFVAPGVQPHIRIGTELQNETVRLWIEDNGIGIDPKYSQRIFRVFERLHGNETYPGTGIGLAIVRKGMERLGGRSGFESTPGEGSRFWIEGQLPKRES
ncbi:MAG: PAS domain-containing protein [Cyanobacteriota bacterium]|nr:PAS domain-containing protein [Cyanobacteriota bacterium]